MDRKIWPYLLLLGTILALLMVVSWLSPKPVDWRKTFNARDKIPFGLYVLDHEIDSLFGTKVTKYRSPLKKYFEKSINLDWSEFQDTFKLAENDSTYDPEENIAEKVDDTLPEEEMVTADEDVVVEEDYNYPSGDSLTSGEDGPKLFIDQRVTWNVQEINVLMAHVNAGHNVMLSASEMPETLLSYAGARVKSLHFLPEIDGTEHDSITLSFTEPTLQRVTLPSKKWLSGSYFDTVSPVNTVILGHFEAKGKNYPNFLMLSHGAGKLYLHLEPMAFTNYFLLRDSSYRYAENVLSYLAGEENVIWFQEGQSVSDSRSALRFILSQPGLKWAWYLALAGTLLFMLVNARRSQRIIRNLPKPANTSVEFVRTIGNLYHLDGNIRKVIDNKIMYFLERVRSEYHVNTASLDEQFIHQLQIRSGKNLKAIKQVVFLIQKHQQFDYDCKIGDLVRINEAIENFYK